jgi:oligosaccharyltransferase complex subunit delta (ribophorin II)
MNLPLLNCSLEFTFQLNFLRVNYPSKASFVLEADSHQRLMMKFTLKDKSTKEPITVHQAFVKLINSNNKEIIFVAEPDTGKSYRFDLVRSKC